MPDLVDDVGIDAKHSYEDAILPAPEFHARWGDRIGVLRGRDLNILSGGSEAEVRILTREPGAQLERIVITADAEANPPFVGQHASVTLRAEDAAVTAPMQVVRHEGCPDAPRMRLRLTAAAPLRHEVQRYDDHLRLDFRATAVRPEFVALLFPLPADLEDPIVDVQFDGDDLCLEVRWPGRTDRIIWPAEEPRRPVVAVEVP